MIEDFNKLQLPENHYLKIAKESNNSYFDEFLEAMNQLKDIIPEKDFKTFWNDKLQLNKSNFNEKSFIQGACEISVANYFGSYANGIPVNILSDYYFDELYYNEQQAYLGYQSFIINPATSNNPDETNYFSGVPSGNYYQENSLESTGFNGKLSFNGSAQYDKVLSIGLNLNAHFVDYRQSTLFYEENDFVPTTTDYSVNRIGFSNDLYTYGNGFSFQVGTIYKPTNELRFGLTYQSPTWLKLYDEVSQSI